MADDVSQVIQMEVEGCKFVLTGTFKMCMWLAQAIKSLLSAGKMKIYERKGEHPLKHIFKLSEPEAPVGIEVPTKFKEEFFKECASKGLHYHVSVDFNLKDGMTPIMVPAKEAGVFAQLANAYMKKKIAEDEAKLSKHDKNIGEIEEKLLSAKPEEKLYLQVQLENIKQARNELVAVVKNFTTKVDEKSYVKTFAQYLEEAKGTEFENDPEKAIAENEHGVPIIRAEDSVDCFQPVRDDNNVPETSTHYIFPEKGVTVCREYHLEKDIVYSEYKFKTESGENYSFSDKNMTKEQWNRNVLPKIFELTGITEGMKCKVFQSEKELQAYVKFHNKTVPKSEKAKAESVVFSNAEVLSQVEMAIQDTLKGMASAKTVFNSIEFSVPQDQIMSLNGKVVYAPEGLKGAVYVFDKITPGNIKDGRITFTADRNSNVIVKQENKMDQSFTAETVRTLISDMRTQIVDAIRNNTQKR